MGQERLYSKLRTLTDRQLDKQRAATAYFELVELLHGLEDLANDLQRYRKTGRKIRHKNLVRESLKECSGAIKDAVKALQ